GLIPFALMLAIRLKWRNAYHGVITGIFFILYAIGRISVENFREPDADLIAGITRGQFYSLFMVVVGIGFLAYGFARKRQNQLLPTG
ncbi:MAG TPA: prolipoprotein diacylglyceryl transferase, partial [Bacteroidia bacterium]|nr:prolipoprotein diacylglyceryl transferase [Bacteroidia bacterium]